MTSKRYTQLLTFAGKLKTFESIILQRSGHACLVIHREEKGEFPPLYSRVPIYQHSEQDGRQAHKASHKSCENTSTVTSYVLYGYREEISTDERQKWYMIMWSVRYAPYNLGCLKFFQAFSDTNGYWIGM